MYGNNHLFIPGPTNVPEPVRQAMNIPMEDMRAPDFGSFTKPLLADLKKVYRTETGTVFLYPSSGTGMWETAITNTLNVGDKVLMSRFGQFSLLWVDMAERLGLDVDLSEVEWGKGVPVEEYAEKLAADKEHQIKAVFATQNETATGVKSDIAAVRKALDDANHPALLFVDGVSSIGSVEWGKGVPIEEYAEKLAADKEHQIKAVFATQNETATGVKSDIAAVRKALDDANHPALLFVDGVSSIGSVEFEMDKWGVDCAVSGSQKGFMLPAGLGILGVSEKALAMRENAKMPRCYFDLQDMLNLNGDGYFPYTPATQLFRGLRVSLDMLLEAGMENVWQRQAWLAAGVHKAVAAWDGCELVARGPEWASDTVSAIYAPDGVDARDVISGAYNKYQTSLGTGLNKLMGKAFRIGHLGSLNPVMLCGAISAAEMALRDAGAKIEPGSGVAAAQEHYREHAG